MRSTLVTTEERYAALVEAYGTDPDVKLGSTRTKGFGANALWGHGQIFAMLSNDRLVVKLPRKRVDQLVASGEGDRFDPRRDGRVMKEWLSLVPGSAQDWFALAQEALEFAASKDRSSA
jgi:hypothetical protein